MANSEYKDEMKRLIDTYEYNIMKYKLANDALNVALWDLPIKPDGPVNPENYMIFSEEFRSALGYNSIEEFPEVLGSWSALLHPDDKERTVNAFKAHIIDTTGQTPYDIEYRLLHKSGEYRHIHALGTTQRDINGTPLRVAGAILDVTEKKQTDQALTDALSESERVIEALAAQDNLLRAVNNAAYKLLTTEDNETFKDSLDEGMNIIGKILDVDCIEVWQNKTVNSEPYASLAHCWFSDIGREKSAKYILESPGFAYSATPKWHERLSSGTLIGGPVRDLSSADREFLEPFKVTSILSIPIFINHIFWGFTCIDDCIAVRNFTPEETDILRSLSYMLAHALNRQALSEEIKEANNQTKLLLDSTPLCCQLFDKNLKKIDCNKEAIRLFGFKDKRDFLERSSMLYPKYQPDGVLSTEKINRYLEGAVEGGSVFFDWTYKMLDGSDMPSQVSLVRIDYADDFFIAGYTRDMREHIKLMSDIEYRGKLLFSVNQAAVYLLNSEVENFESALYESMKTIAETVKVHRMYIWKNFSENNDIFCTKVYEWLESDSAKHKETSTPPALAYPQEWHDILSQGECINCIASERPWKEQIFMVEKGIKSILVVPVIIKESFWGFVGFDDCRKERVFNEEEKSILLSSSILFANSWLRNDLISSVKEHSKQLEISVQQAKAASNAKGEFLSNMSHEMRTPMNAIVGMTAIGKKTKDIAVKDNALDKIGDASSHLLGIINDVLDMAKIEANKLELIPVEFDFDKMLQRVLTVINFRVEEKNQNLTVSLDSNIPKFIIGDDQRLSQVITNLLSNAVKFTPEHGDIKLEAFYVCGDDEEGKCELRIAVTDTGIGISPEQQE
ncbi:MAG: PAS domain-containing protein, partial [Oscillospiraceae bacterium]|nr:PAS domain-containing protein [Oscillospiraceae bacterium]